MANKKATMTDLRLLIREFIKGTSKLPVAKWYDYIKEPTLADAIMDRLTANARRIELKGESIRQKSKEKCIFAPGITTSSEAVHLKPLRPAHFIPLQPAH